MKRNEHKSLKSCLEELDDADLRAVFDRATPDAPVVDAYELFASFHGEVHTRTSLSDRGSSVTTTRTPNRRLVVMAIRTATAASVLGLIAALVFVTSNPRAALAEVQAAVDRLTSATYTISETVGELATQTTRVSVFGDKYVCAERSNGNYFVLDVIDKKMLEVVPSQKKAVLTEEVEVPVHFSLMARINSLNDYAIRGEPNTPQPEFGNKRVMGFVVRLDGVSYNIWVDQDTNLPLRLESYSDDDNVKRVWSDFVYNSKLDKASFSMSPPEGFSLEVLTFAKAREKANERAARAKIESLKQIREQALQRKPAED